MSFKKKSFIFMVISFILLLAIIIIYLIQYDKSWLLNYMDNKSPIISTPSNIFPTTSPTEYDDTITFSEGSILENDTFNENLYFETLDTSIISNDNLPHDKLFITLERQQYKHDDLLLIIPKLNLNEKVKNGTDEDSLAKGPGLYEYSQLPGEGNRNVSIAAHRNTSRKGVIGEWFFYYIDTLTSNDYLYLVDDTSIYKYEYDQTTIIDAYDWGPIYSQGFSCLTLTSCEPIGISTHRIVVRSKLIQIYPYSDDFNYE